MAQDQGVTERQDGQAPVQARTRPSEVTAGGSDGLRWVAGLTGGPAADPGWAAPRPGDAQGPGDDSADAEAPRSSSAARPFRIFHLSDVHFGNHFDESVWNYVGELARRERPDLVVCTGDLVDHGGLFMLAAARQEFEAFIGHLTALNVSEGSSRQVQLRCVPGNHDCGPWGNLKFRPFSTNFGAVFGPGAFELPAGMPSYMAYRRSSWPVRCLTRLRMTPALYARKWWTSAKRFLARQESGYRIELLRSDDPQEVVLVYLDSNDSMRLATGNVNAREVTKLKALMLNLREAQGARPFVPRIALLHHHPLPIPEASIAEGLTSFEPFLVLRNAGLVLKELNKCDVDLILHGHKHYAAFGRLGYSIDHHTEGEIAVLAAGSGGVTHSESGRNSVNLIDILETGRMSFRSIHFGAGGGAPVHEIARGKKEIHGIEMHKARVHRRAAERQGQWIDTVRHAVGVDATGVAVVQQDVSQHWFERPLPTQVVPVVCSVSLGRISHNTIELSEISKSAGYQWVNRPQGPVQRVRAGIHVGRRLTGPALDYGYRYKCFNTYAITRWETIAACERESLQRARVPAGQARRPRVRLAELEVTSYVVRAPLRQLVFRVQLPGGQYPLKPFVQVMRWSTYPATPLDEHLQFHEHGTEGEWVNDAELTAHESGHLSQIGEDVWELRVSYPMVGHRYDVRWRVEPFRPAVPLQDTTRIRGRTLAMRSTLLSRETMAAYEGPLRAWESEFRDVLNSIGSAGRELDDVEIAMFTYDESRHDLVQTLVLAPGKDEVVPQHPLVVPLGEGVIGAAFKRSLPVMYVDPQLSGSPHEAAYLYSEDSPGHFGAALPATRWKYVLAFPLSSYSAGVTPDWGPHTTVGVLTLSSERLDSGLVELVGPMSWLADGALAEGFLTDDAVQEAGQPLESGSDLENGEFADGSDAPTPRRRDLGKVLWVCAHLLVDYLPESPETSTSTAARDWPNAP